MTQTNQKKSELLLEDLQTEKTDITQRPIQNFLKGKIFPAIVAVLATTQMAMSSALTNTTQDILKNVERQVILNAIEREMKKNSLPEPQQNILGLRTMEKNQAQTIERILDRIEIQKILNNIEEQMMQKSASQNPKALNFEEVQELISQAKVQELVSHIQVEELVSKPSDAPAPISPKSVERILDEVENQIMLDQIKEGMQQNTPKELNFVQKVEKKSREDIAAFNANANLQEIQQILNNVESQTKPTKEGSLTENIQAAVAEEFANYRAQNALKQIHGVLNKYNEIENDNPSPKDRKLLEIQEILNNLDQSTQTETPKAKTVAEILEKYKSEVNTPQYTREKSQNALSEIRKVTASLEKSFEKDNLVSPERNETEIKSPIKNTNHEPTPQNTHSLEDLDKLIQEVENTATHKLSTLTTADRLKAWEEMHKQPATEFLPSTISLNSTPPQAFDPQKRETIFQKKDWNAILKYEKDLKNPSKEDSKNIPQMADLG